MTLASSADKPSKTFDELMSTPIDFSAYIMNGLKITNLTQETLLGPAFRLLKGTRSNYVEFEYDFEECYKALSKKLNWENPEGDDYPFDLTKPLPLVMSGNHQKVAQYDLLGIEDMGPNIWVPIKVSYDKHALWGISHWREQLTQVEVMRKHGYGYLKEIVVRRADNGYLKEIVVRRADNDLYGFKEGDFPHLLINDIKDMLLLIKLGYSEASRRSSTGSRKLLEEDQRHQARNYQIWHQEKGPIHSYQDPQGFIYVNNNGRNRLMRSDELYKFSDRTLTGLRTSLDDITKNTRMEYLPKRRWSTLEKKRANIMIKAIGKQLKERRMMRSLEKFVGGRHYGTDLRLLQRTM
ncbi:hypothetical protein Tco_0771827 [Tanacetum coccineum]|uniref:Uncharacterized protein n=1 Tax=Tanacetum coccineum TaxID=301880 RepID=A0ABQ4ZIS7_9ASTR